MTESLRTDWDNRIIDSVSIGLVEVGLDDDVTRLQLLIEQGESKDKLRTACEIAIAWIRFAQDLKNDLKERESWGYL
jgi:hypothetical protein